MKTAKVDYRRHGDVNIFTSEGFSIPESVTLKPGALIHQGSSNSHVIQKGEALFGEKNGEKFMRITKAGLVSHVGGSSTHESKPIPVGDYWVTIQNFYDHLAEESKKVVD